MKNHSMVTFTILASMALAGCGNNGVNESAQPRPQNPAATSSATKAPDASASPSPSARAAHAPAQAATAPAALGALFVHDAIQGNVPWLESIAGPARQVLENGNGTQNRVYKVDGCNVTALTAQNTINALTLDVSPTCNVSIQAMLPSASPLNLAHLTFAEIFKEGATDISLACAGPGECGNSADPSIQAVLGGDRADGFLEVEFSGTIGGDTDTDLLIKMMGEEGKRLGKSDDELTADVYNKDPQLEDLAKTMLGGVRVTSITFKSGS
jgi:hypothetical protein